MFEVLTLLTKTSRIPRTCDPDTLVGEPGIWVELMGDGSVVNVGATAPLIAKVLFNGNSSSVYESHDVSIGRISTLETVGARCHETADHLVGTINRGDKLYVTFGSAAVTAGTTGRLASINQASAATYTSVATCEEVQADGSIVYTIDQPTSITVAAPH